MNLLELPVTLVVKAPNQKIADTRIDCDQQWTVKKLKAHLSDVYPSKPVSYSRFLNFDESIYYVSFARLLRVAKMEVAKYNACIRK